MLNADAAWSIKGNHEFYPMEALHAILKGRLKTKIPGHWVSMTAVTVKLLPIPQPPLRACMDPRKIQAPREPPN
jgi:hypothetical protein